MRLQDRPYALSALRIALAVVGGLGSYWIVTSFPVGPLVTYPGTSRFTFFFLLAAGGLLFFLSLPMIAVALPSLLGADDPLGFRDQQRRVLQFGGAVLLGSLALVVASIFESGLAVAGLAYVTLPLGSLAVLLALLWRAGEALLSVDEAI